MADPQRLEELLDFSADALEQAATRFPVERTGQREPIPPHVRLAVLKRDGFRCDWCGCDGFGQPFHLDHIHPWSAGGSDDTTNLRTLCSVCNEMRSNYRTDAPYVRRMPCTLMCVPCMGWDVERDEYDDDEWATCFCSHCNRASWVFVGSQAVKYGCSLV